MTKISLLIHTHSDYSYLWRVIQDYTKDIKINKILAYNTTSDIDQLPSCFNQYISYNANTNFARRIVKILEQLDDDYIFLVYDVDIIINFDLNVLQKYIEIIEENNIERVNSSLFNGASQIHKDGYALCDLNKPLKCKSNHFVPIDCAPVIWKRESFTKLLKLFPNESYASLELNKDVINYCKKNVKCYGIQYTPNLQIKYNRGLTMCHLFQFLHITTKGRFLKPFSVYMDYEKILHQIVKKYNIDMDKIGYSDALHVFRSFSKLKI